jgi:hypothetical protein
MGTRTAAHTHARARAHTHTHTHTRARTPTHARTHAHARTAAPAAAAHGGGVPGGMAARLPRRLRQVRAMLCPYYICIIYTYRYTMCYMCYMCGPAPAMSWAGASTHRLSLSADWVLLCVVYYHVLSIVKCYICYYVAL